MNATEKMNTPVIDTMTPAEYVAWLYGQTDAEGTLAVPIWNDDGTVAGTFDAKNVLWNEADRDRMTAEAETMIRGIYAIAKLHDRLSDSEEENEKVLSPELMQIWRMYLCKFETSFDDERIADIIRRKDTLREIDHIRDKQLMGEYCAPYEYDLLEENGDIAIEPEDEHFYGAYQAVLGMQARQRVGSGPDALELVRHGQRLYTLIAHGLSDVMIRMEEKRLIQSMVLHAFTKRNKTGADSPLQEKTDEMTPAEYLAWLFDQTDAGGVLMAPVWSDGNTIRSPHPSFYRCDMEWSRKDLDRLAAAAEALLGALFELAKEDRQLSDSEAENAKVLSPKLLNFWRTYIRPFDTASFDLELIRDIEMRMEIMDEVDDIAHTRDSGKTLDEYEQSFLEENRDVMIDPDEMQLYNTYRQSLYKQSEQRVGVGPAAYQLVIRTKRVFRLMTLMAPKLILNAEKKCLIQAVAFHACAKSFTVIEPTED